MGVRARLRRVPPLVLVLGVAFALSGVAVAVQVAPSIAQACGSNTYSTRGVVKSFGPDRKFVNIAHEKIAGYMEAMTMSFEPRTAADRGSARGAERGGQGELLLHGDGRWTKAPELREEGVTRSP
jgi:Cu/Ag efflux protein CusF